MRSKRRERGLGDAVGITLRRPCRRVTYTPSGVTVPYAMAKVSSISFAWTIAMLRPRAMRTRGSIVGGMAGTNAKVTRGEAVASR
jgi:hypothetical protein